MNYLQGKRINLRALDPSDAPFMAEIEADSLNFDYSGATAPYSASQLLEYAAGYDADPLRAGQLRLVIETAESSPVLPSDPAATPVGLLDFTEISARDAHATVGICIAEPFRRQGYARDALATGARYAADVLRLGTLAARIDATNTASLNLFRSAGWQQCGTIPNWLYSPRHRRNVDMHIFFLTL